MDKKDVLNELIEIEKNNPLKDLARRCHDAGITEEEIVGWTEEFRSRMSYATFVKFCNYYRDICNGL